MQCIIIKKDCSSKPLFEKGNAKITLIEDYPCERKEQLHARERYWLEDLENVVNKQHPARTIKEWVKDNKEHLGNYSKEYYENNKKQVLYKEYYENLRDIKIKIGTV